jgi:hypothetical protein
MNRYQMAQATLSPEIALTAVEADEKAAARAARLRQTSPSDYAAIQTAASIATIRAMNARGARR